LISKPKVLFLWLSSLFIPHLYGQSLPGAGDLQRQSPSPYLLQPPIKPNLDLATPQLDISTDQTRFEVQNIVVHGGQSLDENVIKAITCPFEGKLLSLGDLETIANQITDAYQRAGFLLSRAFIPEQTLEDSTVYIEVLEAKYDKITLNNLSSIKDSVFLKTLKQIRPDQSVNERPLNESLLLLSEIPGVTTNSSLRPGSDPKTTELVVDVTPGAPYAGSFTFDQYGSYQTGINRITGAVQFNNPFDLGDFISLNATTAGPGMQTARLGYTAPIDGQATLLSAYGSTLNYNLNNHNAALQASGTANLLGSSMQQTIRRSQTENLSVLYALELNTLKDHIDSVSPSSKTDRHVQKGIVTLNGNHTDADVSTVFSSALTIGNLAFDDATAKAKDAASSNNVGTFQKISFDLVRRQDFSSNGEVLFSLGGQLASKNLDSSEKYSLGGYSSIRAYDVSAISGAQGYKLTAEYRQPVAHAFISGTLQAVLFYDMGRVQVMKNTISSGENFATLSGMGLGMNWAGAQGFSSSLSVAVPTGDLPALLASRDSYRAWFQLQKSF